MKNPVGSAIEIASFGETNLVSQGEKIGSKISKQQIKWSDRNFVEKLPHYNQSESFPQDSENMLGVVDTFDVPMSEKSVIENFIINNLTNNSNTIFINTQTNI